MKLIRNVYLPKSNKKLKPYNVLFSDKIVKISDEVIEDEQIDEIIDAEGMYLLPGAIDAQVHYTSLEEGESYFNELGRLAVKGGFTSVIENPAADSEALLNTEQFDSVKKKIGKPILNFGILSKIDSKDAPFYFEDMEELWDKGTLGFQIYTLTDCEDIDFFSYEEINDLFSDVPDKEMMISINAIDNQLIDRVYDSLPEDELAENQISALTKIVRRSLDNPIHFTYANTFKSINYLISAQKRFDISFDLKPEYFLHLHNQKLVELIFARTYQKRNEERNNLKDMFKFCRASILATHSGYKDRNLIDNSDMPFGTPNDYPHHIPFLYTRFYSNPKAQISQFINLISENAARAMKIYPRKGSIEEGADADFMLLDPNYTYTVDDKDSNYNQFEMKCRVYKTYVMGEIAFDHKDGISKNKNGRFIERNIL
ncbi:MAG: amidohydrolase family protein [Candidatus Cloacimonetes bacterium]|nr:amidohydrolase family protein [Candidatus Cloacimonadota bacterium]